MPYTPEQVRQNRILSRMGYKITEGIPLGELEIGDNVIVITLRGEPIMSGTIASMDEMDGNKQAQVGDRWYSESEYQFRRM